MYTQCPQCLTYFQVTPEHLKVAQGNVRCGQCRNVFSALGNLTELPPEAVSHPIGNEKNTAKKQNFAENMSATISDFERDLADEKDAVAKPPKSSNGLSAAIEKINQLNKRSSSLTARNKAAPAPAPAPAKTKAKPEKKPEPVATPPAAATREKPKPMPSSAPYVKPAAKPSAKPAAAASDTRTALQPIKSPQPRKRPPPAKPKPRVSGPSIDVDAALSAIDSLDITSERPMRRQVVEDITLSSEPIQDQVALSERRVKSLERPVQSSPNLPAVARASSAIPKALLEDFQRAKAAAIMARQSAKGMGWIAGSVLLMVVFLGQTIYFKYNDLARISGLRPWMERFCDLTHCELSLPFNIKKLELLGQDIRSHPKIRKALLVTVTLINRADHTQAYPGLEITFMDLNSQLVAMRRFLPADYLAPGVNVEAGIPANTPIEVELQLIDPGSKAINFEFDMFRAS